MIAASLLASHPASQVGHDAAAREPLAVSTTRVSRWQQALSQAVTDPRELIRMLGLSEGLSEGALQATQSFPLRVPRGFIARMRHGDANDPLLRQVLPLGAETVGTPGYTLDPVGDLASRAVSGVLHKYEGRALVIATGACGVHCRYCFRRHFPYGDELASAQGWAGAIAFLRADSSIREVILSGGDPLSLNDRRLQQLTDALAGLPHITRLRIHTRQPIVLPERIDPEFIAWLDGVRLQKVMVVHANHANELNAEVAEAMAAVRNTGTMLLNQAVLLAGVNDSIVAQVDLSEALARVGILPYYLHLLDRVQGAAHFEVPEAHARTLMRGLSSRLPGYLVPRLVRETAGKASKSLVEWA
jgi:EF-P beta-lysylation protein EpmB